MRELIIQILKKNLELKLIDEDIAAWRSIENDPNTDVPVSYAYDEVIYQNAYFSDIYIELIDMSNVIYNGGIVVGVWPIGIYKDAKGYRVGSLGRLLLPPLLRESGNIIETKRKML